MILMPAAYDISYTRYLFSTFTEYFKNERYKSVKFNHFPVNKYGINKLSYLPKTSPNK